MVDVEDVDERWGDGMKKERERPSINTPQHPTRTPKHSTTTTQQPSHPSKNKPTNTPHQPNQSNPSTQNQPAYFFTRSILLCIRTLEGRDRSPFDTEWKGWVLTAGFFVNAWLLGE